MMFLQNGILVHVISTCWSHLNWYLCEILSRYGFLTKRLLMTVFWSSFHRQSKCWGVPFQTHRFAVRRCFGCTACPIWNYILSHLELNFRRLLPKLEPNERSISWVTVAPSLSFVGFSHWRETYDIWLQALERASENDTSHRTGCTQYGIIQQSTIVFYSTSDNSRGKIMRHFVQCDHFSEIVCAKLSRCISVEPKIYKRDELC